MKLNLPEWTLEVYDVHADKSAAFAKKFKGNSHQDMRSCVLNADLVLLGEYGNLLSAVLFVLLSQLSSLYDSL